MSNPTIGRIVLVRARTVEDFHAGIVVGHNGPEMIDVYAFPTRDYEGGILFDCMEYSTDDPTRNWWRWPPRVP
jgi:hypothetical protein